MRLSAHLPLHRSLHSCAPCVAPCGQRMLAVLARVACRSSHSVTEATPTFESKRGEGKGCASSRNFRALTPSISFRSFRHGSKPIFQIFFFLALTRLLSRTPRGLLSLGESPLGVLFKKAGFNSREKKLRGSGRIKGDGESLGCQVKGTVNNCGGFR